jgi:hypothetical protein
MDTYFAKIWKLSQDEEGPVIKIKEISHYVLLPDDTYKWKTYVKMKDFAELMEGYDLLLIPKKR